MIKWLQPARWADRGNVSRWAALGLVAVLIFSGATVWALRPETHSISVLGLGDTVTFTTTQNELGAALKAQGIQLGDKDQISIPLSTSLKGKKTLSVQVEKAAAVSVLVDGKTLEVATTAKTVDALLKELSVTLGPNDGLSADLKAPVKAGMQLQVVRRSEQTVVEREEIPFETEREDDRSMVVGESREVQAGSPGYKEVKKVVYMEDGREVRSEVVEETLVKAPVNQIVAVGTGGVVSRGGRSYRYSRELTLSATGYTAGKESNPDGIGITYTGMRAVRGVVAVDPTVIPLYTRLYIEGYGPAVAGDIGGAIKGNKIDLCFDTLEEALNWGRRPVTVYILNE